MVKIQSMRISKPFVRVGAEKSNVVSKSVTDRWVEMGTNLSSNKLFPTHTYLKLHAFHLLVR